jgi:hypothetical protein
MFGFLDRGGIPPIEGIFWDLFREVPNGTTCIEEIRLSMAKGGSTVCTTKLIGSRSYFPDDDKWKW